MNYLILAFALTILLPIAIVFKGEFYNRLSLSREMKDKLTIIAKQALREQNMLGWKPSDFRNLKIEEGSDGSEMIEFETFILDVHDGHKKWNNPEKFVKIVAHIKGAGNIDIKSFGDEHAKDIGALIPEDTDNILELSRGMPNKAREYVTSHQHKTNDSQYKNVQQCLGTGASSVICKNPISRGTDRTKLTALPTTKLMPRYGNLNNETLTVKRQVKSKYECDIMKPNKSEIHLPPTIVNWACKTRYDLDYNGWRAHVDPSVANDLSNLE